MQNCVCVQKQQKWVLSRVLISCEFKLNMLLAVISRLDAVVVSFPLRQYHLYRTFDKAVTSSRCLGDVYTDTSTHAITRTWKSKKCCKFWEKRNVRGKTNRTWIFTWLCSAWLLCQHYWKLKDRKCSWYWKSRAMWINANILFLVVVYSKSCPTKTLFFTNKLECKSYFYIHRNFKTKISCDHLLIWVLRSQEHMLSIIHSTVLLREKLKRFSEVEFSSKHHWLLPSVT